MKTRILNRVLGEYHDEALSLFFTKIN